MQASIFAVTIFNDMIILKINGWSDENEMDTTRHRNIFKG
jgi:hypothetical protein